MSICPPELGIEAIGLGHRYADLLAVDGVSFSVRRGEVYGLLGPNGAGKTTLLRMLVGILRPSFGTARIAGIDVATSPMEIRRRLGFLSGDTALYARLTVEECLAYFSRLHGQPDEVRRARIAAVVEAFELGELVSERIAALSTGQLKRANLARAFLTDPEVIILDEPTSGLDVVSGQFVLEAVRRAKAANKAVLFSTHIMSEVELLCDRIGVLVRGRLVDEGELPALLAKSGARNLTEHVIARHREGGRT